MPSPPAAARAAGRTGFPLRPACQSRCLPVPGTARACQSLSGHWHAQARPGITVSRRCVRPGPYLLVTCQVERAGGGTAASLPRHGQISPFCQCAAVTAIRVRPPRSESVKL
jgi:hypothetical protein